MIIEELDPAAAQEWDAYVTAKADANCYHLHGWRAVGERGYGLRAPFLAARTRPRGELLGVLPLFFIEGALSRGYATTGLFGAYGRVLAESEEIGRALIEDASLRAARSGLGSLRCKALGEEPCAPGFTPFPRWVVATLPLPATAAEAWHGLRGKVRNCIRKAQRFGFEVRDGEVAGFYDVLAENMHRKGSPIYGLRLMRALASAFGPAASVITLRHQGRTVSGALTLTFNGVVTVPFASSRPGSFHMNPNNLLYWEIISRACISGQHTLDFGRSLRDSTTLAFKLGWGAVATPQPLLVRTLRGKAPRVDAETPLVRGLVSLWQRLPRRLADLLGPWVCQRFLA